MVFDADDDSLFKSTNRLPFSTFSDIMIILEFPSTAWKSLDLEILGANLALPDAF